MAEKACHAFASTTRFGLTLALALMRYFAWLLLLIPCVVWPAENNPTLVSFNWSRDQGVKYDRSNYRKVATRMDGSIAVATVITTTTSSDDLRRARAWILTKGRETTLCFSAPGFPTSPSSDGYAPVGVAYLTLLTYRISGLPLGSPLSFRDDCRAER